MIIVFIVLVTALASYLFSNARTDLINPGKHNVAQSKSTNRKPMLNITGFYNRRAFYYYIDLFKLDTQ